MTNLICQSNFDTMYLLSNFHNMITTIDIISPPWAVLMAKGM